MSSRPPIRHVARALLGFAAAATAPAQTPLPKESPFAPPAGTTAAPAASGEAIEFAGVSIVDKKTSVSIYDKQAKKGKWIGVGETIDGITVIRYDSAQDRVVVRVNGAEKALSLRKSSTQTQAPAAVSTLPLPLPAAAPVAPAAEPAVVLSTPAAATGPAPGGAPAPTPAAPASAPPAPGSVAHQEQEARMLVSDLLEIGAAQRQAYEEAQKKAAEQRASSPPPAPRAQK